MYIFLSLEAKAPAAIIISSIQNNKIEPAIKDFTAEKYGNIIDSIGIITNCFPEEMILRGFGKERRYISYKQKMADIRLRIDFDELCKADRRTQLLIYIKHMLDSIKVIDKRVNKKFRTGFNGEKLCSDILNVLNVTISDLETI